MARKVGDRKGTVISEEVGESEFADARLGARFKKLVCQLSENMGAGISVACEDWANTKAAYRFLSNARVGEEDIFSGHFKSTQRRFRHLDEAVLILHDTTEFSFKRKDTEAIGLLKKLPKSSTMTDVYGEKYLTTCGILMHSSLVVTLSGVPLGLAAAKFWTRDQFKGTNALKNKINPTRIPIEQKESIRWLENIKQSSALIGEPSRCIHVGDRESDIYELFHTAEAVNTYFLVRTCVDRLAGDGNRLVSEEVSQSPLRGIHTINIRNKNGVEERVKLDVKYCTLRICPPISKKKRYSPLLLTVIEAAEKSAPRGREPIAWKLLTNLPVKSLAEAKEKIRWYAMRWKIETFHKILKSGCRAEDSRLRTAERLVNLIAIFCILSWRIFWMTMLNRQFPAAKAGFTFTVSEIAVLSQLAAQKGKTAKKALSLGECISQVARLGGYLARAKDPPPGNMVIWRGIIRLSDLVAGASLGISDEICG